MMKDRQAIRYRELRKSRESFPKATPMLAKCTLFKRVMMDSNSPWIGGGRCVSFGLCRLSHLGLSHEQGLLHRGEDLEGGVPNDVLAGKSLSKPLMTTPRVNSPPTPDVLDLPSSSFR